MIKNISYNYKEVNEEISGAVGKSYSFMKRLKLGGSGSQRYVIIEAFNDIEQLYERDNKTRFCNIELREKGIILHFRTRQETYGWLVPYYLMSLFKSDDSFSIFSGAEFVRLRAAHNAKLNHSFINKILNQKTEQFMLFNDIPENKDPQI
jgi:hypothetical protein